MCIPLMYNCFYCKAEMDALQRTNDDLMRGKKTLDDMLQKIEKEQVCKCGMLHIPCCVKEQGWFTLMFKL